MEQIGPERYVAGWSRHMKFKHIVVGSTLALVILPLVLALAVGAWSYALDRTNGAIVSSGRKRTYLLHVPPHYDRSKPTPLVISLHGAAVWPAHQMNLTGWNRLADEQGFIVVYPSGAGRIWHVDRGPGLMEDVQFIADLIDTLRVKYPIDSTRVYVNGFSLGGGMTFALSCTLSDRIAAVGMVAAAQTLPFSWCADRRPVPMIAFHGTADMVPYRGGPSPDPFNPLMFPAVRVWVSHWARRNRCGPHPLEATIAADVTRLEYTHCADSAAVVLYTIHGGGHTWPGGKPLPAWLVGPTSHSVDATSEMWSFFQKHPKAPA
jgi:polyhydroxybutyrate depolymerase